MSAHRSSPSILLPVKTPQMKYKTVFVRAPGLTYEKKNFLGSETKESQKAIDGNGLARACEISCNELADQGYEVISVTEITCGSTSFRGDYGGAGWSLTDGILITAKLIT